MRARLHARGFEEAEACSGMILPLDKLPGAARDAGYNLGVLHSSPMAKGLYEKIGFHSVTTFRVYGPPAGFHI